MPPSRCSEAALLNLSRVIRLETTQSTNADAMRLAREGESGPLWVVAREQAGGRGGARARRGVAPGRGPRPSRPHLAFAARQSLRKPASGRSVPVGKRAATRLCRRCRFGRGCLCVARQERRAVEMAERSVVRRRESFRHPAGGIPSQRSSPCAWDARAAAPSSGRGQLRAWSAPDALRISRTRRRCRKRLSWRFLHACRSRRRHLRRPSWPPQMTRPSETARALRVRRRRTPAAAIIRAGCCRRLVSSVL